MDFSDADTTVTRSVRGNPKASVFALWSIAGGHRAGKLAGVTQEEGGGAEGGGLTGVGAGATWAVRVNECQGGSLHIGCITNAYKVLNLLSYWYKSTNTDAEGLACLTLTSQAKRMRRTKSGDSLASSERSYYI